MASIFANVEVGPKIEVFALNKMYVEDTSSVKVNLGVGGKLFTSILCMRFKRVCVCPALLNDIEIALDILNFSETINICLVKLHGIS